MYHVWHSMSRPFCEKIEKNFRRAGTRDGKVIILPDAAPASPFTAPFKPFQAVLFQKSTEINFCRILFKTHRATMGVRRPAFHGRSHAIGTGISRRVEQRVQGSLESWSIQVKLGPIQGKPLVAALRAAKSTSIAQSKKVQSLNRRPPPGCPSPRRFP